MQFASRASGNAIASASGSALRSEVNELHSEVKTLEGRLDAQQQAQGEAAQASAKSNACMQPDWPAGAGCGGDQAIGCIVGTPLCHKYLM